MNTGLILISAVLALVGIGLYALLVVRNLFQVIIALQLLAKGAILALVLDGDAAGRLQLGQSLALTVIVADTAVVVVGMALAIQAKKQFGTLDVAALSTLRR